MSHQSTISWQGQPLHSLSREKLELAAEHAISELICHAERERAKGQHDLILLAFAAGAVLAGLGALLGLVLSH